MTICFSFDVLIKLNPIQVNIEEAGLHKNKKGGGIKNRTVTSRYWKLQYRLVCHTTSQLKKLVERKK